MSGMSALGQKQTFQGPSITSTAMKEPRITLPDDSLPIISGRH
jgi:hypothetical protein